MVDGTEEWVAPQNRGFIARLEDLGIPVTVESGAGTHTWPFWERALERSLPALMGALDRSRLGRLR